MLEGREEVDEVIVVEVMEGLEVGGGGGCRF